MQLKESLNGNSVNNIIGGPDDRPEGRRCQEGTIAFGTL
jgi:hypothetical protein